MHTYPGLFENGAFRPRIHRNGHTYPHVSGAFGKRSGPKTELFENAPESGSFENGGFGSGSFLRVNMLSGSFLHVFPRRSKMACPSDEYCFTCICSLFAETGSSSFLFVWNGVFFFFFFFFFFYSSQTPVATGRIVGLSGGGARYTRPTCGLGVLMCLVHQEERRERDKRAQRDG